MSTLDEMDYEDRALMLAAYTLEMEANQKQAKEIEKQKKASKGKNPALSIPPRPPR